MRRLAPVLMLAALAMGCAPSLRMVHQSNAYFEQCHAADFDPTVTPELRRQCWARWLQHYTYGQPPDRVDYARSRIAALEDGEEIEPLPGLGRAAVDGSYTASFFSTRTSQRAREQAAEQQAQPEGAEAPQAADGEDTADARDAAEGTEQPADLSATAGQRVEPTRELPEPPDTHGACATVCTPRWNACISRCDDRPDSCREACVTEHRTCMRGCF